VNGLPNNIQVDFHSDEPLFLQIARQVQQLVLSGVLKPGDQLPTVRELATDLRINFNTVARAYRLLDEATVISTKHGRGTFILEQPPPQALARLRQQSLTALARRFLREAVRLGASPNEALQELRQQVKQLKENGDLSDHE
jgi:GntR family transcriptional regulator